MTGMLITAALLVLDVLSIVDVFKNVSDPLKKAIWIIAIFMLPLIGPLAYYLLGRRGPLVGDHRIAR
jgi:hypothetical protein